MPHNTTTSGRMMTQVAMSVKRSRKKHTQGKYKSMSVAGWVHGLMPTRALSEADESWLQHSSSTSSAIMTVYHPSVHPAADSACAACQTNCCWCHATHLTAMDMLSRALAATHLPSTSSRCASSPSTDSRAACTHGRGAQKV
jgi:hypothetical protein